MIYVYILIIALISFCKFAVTAKSCLSLFLLPLLPVLTNKQFSTTIEKLPSPDWLKKHLCLPALPVSVLPYIEALHPSNRARIIGLSGVYGWYELTTGKVYVGSTKSLNDRTFEHMDKQGPVNKNFRDALKLYGHDSFLLIIFDIVGLTQDVIAADHLAREQIYLDCIPEEFKFNLSKKATAPRGSFIRSDKFKKDLSAVSMGELNPNYGKKATDQTIAKLRLAKANYFRAIQLIEICNENVTVFDSVASLVRHSKIPRSTIKHALENGSVLRQKYYVRDATESQKLALFGNSKEIIP